MFSRRPGHRFNRGRIATASAFSPADIPGLVAWFDMQDSGSYTVTSGAVSSIKNKASGVFWTEAGSTQRPTYNATGINGLPCMDFDGVNDRIISTEAAVVSALSVANSYTLLYVAIFDTLSRDDSLFAAGNSATSLGIRSWGQDTTGAGRWSVTTLTDGGASVKSISVASSVPGAHVHCWDASPTQVTRQLNNWTEDPLNSAHAPGATTSNRVALGCRPRSTPTLFFDGKKGELLLYSSRLPTTDKTRLFNYLYGRWAITPLHHVITQGDSITAGTVSGTPIASYLSVTGAIISNVATGGRKASEILATDIDGEMTQFRASGEVICWLLAGSNDLATGDGTVGNYATPAQVLGYLSSIVTRLRAIGMSVVTGTILYRQASAWNNNPDYNTAVDTINVDIRANVGSVYGDYIVDTNAIAVANGGFSQYVDGTHPNATLTAALAAGVQVGIDSAVAARGW